MVLDEKTKNINTTFILEENNVNQASENPRHSEITVINDGRTD